MIKLWQMANGSGCPSMKEIADQVRDDAPE